MCRSALINVLHHPRCMRSKQRRVLGAPRGLLEYRVSNTTSPRNRKCRYFRVPQQDPSIASKNPIGARPFSTSRRNDCISNRGPSQSSLRHHSCPRSSKDQRSSRQSENVWAHQCDLEVQPANRIGLTLRRKLRKSLRGRDHSRRTSSVDRCELLAFPRPSRQPHRCAMNHQRERLLPDSHPAP